MMRTKLHSFLLFGLAIGFGGLGWVFFNQSDVAARNTVSEVSSDGIVQGAQNERSPYGVSTATPAALPYGGYQPLRRASASTLAVPDAHASLILDVDSGTILHYANGRERRSIASLTKLMTALVVIDATENLDAPVTITREALAVDGTVVGCPRAGYCIDDRLFVGEQVRVRDLLTAMLMNSTNDAATALAIHVGGSQEKFVARMNARAEELGLRDTRFCTPSGLDIESQENLCYSTAYDIARVATHLLTYPAYAIVWETMRREETTITDIIGTRTHRILNTDELLGRMDGLLGAKTGFTPQAGRSLLLAATDPSGTHKIIAVLMDDPYRWRDVQEMIAWAFHSYEWQ